MHVYDFQVHWDILQSVNLEWIRCSSYSPEQNWPSCDERDNESKRDKTGFVVWMKTSVKVTRSSEEQLSPAQNNLSKYPELRLCPYGFRNYGPKLIKLCFCTLGTYIYFLIKFCLLITFRGYHIPSSFFFVLFVYWCKQPTINY